MVDNVVNSEDFFKHTWNLRSIMGMSKEQAKTMRWKAIRVIHATSVVTFITIMYPIHLVLMLFKLPNPADNVKNLAFALTICSNSIKYFWTMHKITNILEMLRTFRQLDERVTEKDERFFFHTKMRTNIRNILFTFLVIYIPIGLTAVLTCLFRNERSLMYPACFPFDVRKSVLNIAIANGYQIIGLGFNLVTSLNNELWNAFFLCVAAGHARLLGMRVAKIGYKNPQNYEENEAELLSCILDQKILYRLFYMIQDFISVPMFIQITANVVIVGLGLALTIFYVQEPAERAYYILYSVGLPLQIFPACFYGTYLEFCLQRLHYSAFCSNWFTQRQVYKKNLMLFIERSLKPNMMMAGGMLKVSLETFFQTCKGAYSVLAVLMQR